MKHFIYHFTKAFSGEKFPIDEQKRTALRGELVSTGKKRVNEKKNVSFLFPNSTSPTLGKFCGTSRPYPVYSGGQYLRVTLHSSNTGVNMDHFFKAQYNLINAKPSSRASEY